MKAHRKFIFAICGISLFMFFAGAFFASAICVAPPAAVSSGQMRRLSRCINEFYVNYGRVPADLRELCRSGYADKAACIDHWGNPIEMATNRNGTVVLKSGGDPKISLLNGRIDCALILSFAPSPSHGRW